MAQPNTKDLSVADKKIIAEFCQLVDKSRQFFNGLRELPQFGNKHWQTHFGRTFDVYTKLWKFQQQHRNVLDTKYNLKRWQIGEIASKIGQLYYHYYLRTSEANYLYESFSFYSAIRSRAYYSQASKEESPDLMVKKLRYYARFIVVSLLLNKMELVRELIRELGHYVEEYSNVYVTEDEEEWQLVMSEVTAFVEADGLVSVMTPDVVPVLLSNRLKVNGVPSMQNSATTSGLTLQEIFIVGLCEKQIKFSELTLDMFRMLQALEHEPEENIAHTLETTEGQTGQISEKTEKQPNRPRNPHKYLLYKPTFSQLFTFLASGFKELPTNSVMLLYLSGDPVLGSSKSVDDDPYTSGGVATCNKNKQTDESKRKHTHIKESHCLYPDDLIPFTRKPLVVIVDSLNSDAFKKFPTIFGQPLLCFMSPSTLPNAFQDQSRYGSLFTLFLHSPLVAFCYVCNVSNIGSDLWDKGHAELDKFMVETLRTFSDWSRSIDHTYFQLMDDDFLRLLVLRYIFAFCTMRLHQAFKSFEYYPKCFPSLPSEVLDHGGIQKHILEIATLMDARVLFYEIGEAPPF